MDDLICEICHKKGFKDARGLSGHIRIAHSVKGKRVDGYDGMMKGMRRDIINHILVLQDRFVELEEKKTEITSRFGDGRSSIFDDWFGHDDKKAQRQMRNEVVEAIEFEQKEIQKRISEFNKQIGFTKVSTKTGESADKEDDDEE